MATRPLRHPDIDSVSVVDILHALADPVRLAIVVELMDAQDGMSCVETMSRVELVLPKSTCSQHFHILREAGLIRCERRGVELSSRLRIREIEGRFPGLLMSILRSYDKERAGLTEAPSEQSPPDDAEPAVGAGAVRRSSADG
jgi:DNA-binding transcriptional ArsR family regulator